MRQGKNLGTAFPSGETRPLGGLARGIAARDGSPGKGRGTGTDWKLLLRRADAALGRNDLKAAEAATHTAFVEAAAGETWEGLLGAGNLYLRIGKVAGVRQIMGPPAHRAYLAALVTAFRQQSLDGVLRTAEAYAACGQRETAAQILALAESMGVTTPNGNAGDMVRALRDRLGMH